MVSSTFSLLERKPKENEQTKWKQEQEVEKTTIKI
jgi:hypothetical protein